MTQHMHNFPLDVLTRFEFTHTFHFYRYISLQQCGQFTELRIKTHSSSSPCNITLKTAQTMQHTFSHLLHLSPPVLLVCSLWIMSYWRTQLWYPAFNTQLPRFFSLRSQNLNTAYIFKIPDLCWGENHSRLSQHFRLYLTMYCEQVPLSIFFVFDIRKLGRWHWGRNVGWRCLRIGCWGECLGLRGTR
jgi:hypothetical protein